MIASSNDIMGPYITPNYIRVAKAVLQTLHLVVARPSGAIGLLVFVTHMVFVIFGPWLVPHDPLLQDSQAILTAPSWSHPFGTDHLGRDILSRTILGGRTAMIVTFLGVLLAVVWGASAGVLAALRGGLVDNVIMRFVEAISALPYLLFLLLLSGFSALGDLAIVPALGLFYGTAVVRVARAATQSVVASDFVAAALVRGETTATVLYKEIAPNVLDVIIVDGALRWSAMLLAFSSLSFLGFGVAPPTPDWGLMISDTRHVLAIAPWATLWPCIALSTLIIGLNLLSDAMAKAIGLDFLQGNIRQQ